MSSSRSLSSALAPLDQGSVWLNTEPIGVERLQGRVVAVDFWTYSCVNWLRTLPYLSTWAERYQGRGLVIVGVHSPEFGFEHDLDNVRGAVAALAVDYPVVIDNDFVIWRAFGNRYWPALYLVDGQGRLRFHHFGEGAYETIERAIQEHLSIDEAVSLVDAGGLAQAADWDAVRSPETYLGSGRSDGRSQQDREELALNQWTLGGEWQSEEEAVVLRSAPGSIAYRFHARDLNLVLAPPAVGGEVPFRVRLDGEEPGDARGVDVDEGGQGTLVDPRMYQLVRQRGEIAERTFEITFLEAGARAYVFTFG
jgi:thiol-disulfide isomerase/thioredoxin